MANNNIYIGIDLGTTNSVIAWGRFDSEKNTVEPQVIEIPMLNINEEVVARSLLPSCIYFREKDVPIVGEYGKSRTSPVEVNRITKSFKTEMGRNDWQRQIDGEFYSAADLSSKVLMQLKGGAEQTLFRNIPFPDDVAIAVPASFEDEMREATMSAARLAGFKNPILVDEPVAVLHDFHNCLCSGDIPTDRREEFNFEPPGKLVLVFDLGGGTLDVSLHQVKYGQDQRDLRTIEIEKSRFTKIGGNNFDEKLAGFLLKKYQEEEDPSQLPNPLEKSELAAKFQLYAEDAKIRLSNQIGVWQSFYGHSDEDELDPNSVKGVINGIPYKNKPFNYELSLSEYEKCVESLLAPELTLDSVDLYNPPEEPDNIIDPILYVLKEVEKKSGSIPKPNIVLLNGSMAKLYTIQQRLEDFFGFPPIDVVDMDLAVARGAVVYLVEKIRSAQFIGGKPNER